MNLNADLVAQLRCLFGTARNTHRNLALHPVVDLTEVSRALGGYTVKAATAEIIARRWAEWRGVFLADANVTGVARIGRDWDAGDCYDPRCYDPVSERRWEHLGVTRFALVPK